MPRRPGRILAVSYTHLDVYKRQALHIRSLLPVAEENRSIKEGTCSALLRNQGAPCFQRYRQRSPGAVCKKLAFIPGFVFIPGTGQAGIIF